MGRHSGSSVIVVGRGTEDERLFTRKAFAEATEYAKATKSHIENLPTTSLCDQAVTDLLGA